MGPDFLHKLFTSVGLYENEYHGSFENKALYHRIINPSAN